MERASAALCGMDYLACESACLEALAEARHTDNWAEYGRILMPLQESRRQRRLIAADSTIRLGTTDLDGPADRWLDQVEAGCLVVTRPHQATDAARIAAAARSDRRFVEVLFADNRVGADPWTLRSFAGPPVSCQVIAPGKAWVDWWLKSEQAEQPAAWFLGATEALGDAALAQIDAQLDGRNRVTALEQRLAVVTDHEILHQRLGDAARVLTAESHR